MYAGQTTMEIPTKLQFDVAALSAFMEKNVKGFKGTLSAKKFGMGQSNPTFLLTTSAGQNYVMRKQPSGKLIKGAHRLDREAQVLSALYKQKFPVPEVYVLCSDNAVLGSMFYIMSFNKGTIADNGMTTQPESMRKPMLLAMARTLAQLHSFDANKIGLGDYGKHSGFYERQIKTMANVTKQQVAGGQGKVAAIPRLSELLAWFESHMPEDRATIIHGDYKPDNIVFKEGTSTVYAVLDWELSTIGHPFSDLANLLLPYYLPKGGGYSTFFAEDGGLLPGIPKEAEIIECYCTAAGVPVPSNWEFFIIFAIFRLAVILQGVCMRDAIGQASSSGAFPYAMSGPILQFFSDVMWKLIVQTQQRSKL